MANPWFKMHTDFYHCPKVQSMSEAMQRRLLMLLCLRGAEELEYLTDDEIKCALRISTRQWQITKSLFMEKGFIDDALHVINWDERQHITLDGKTPEERNRELARERTRQWRMRKKDECDDGSEDTADVVTHTVTQAVTVDASQCDAGVTSQKRHVTLPDTDTDKETETEEQIKDDATGFHPVALRANASPSPSPSPSPSQETETPKKSAHKKPSNVLGVDDVIADCAAQPQHVRDWITARKVPLTLTAWEGIKREADKAGITVAHAVQVCAEKGWRGFNAGWYQNLNVAVGQTARASPDAYPPVTGGTIPLVRTTTMQAADMAKKLLFENKPDTMENEHAKA